MRATATAPERHFEKPRFRSVANLGIPRRQDCSTVCSRSSQEDAFLVADFESLDADFDEASLELFFSPLSFFGVVFSFSAAAPFLYDSLR